jgi:hypothetical protein
MEDGLIETYRAAFGYLPRLPMMREYGLRDGHGFRRFEGYSWLSLKSSFPRQDEREMFRGMVDSNGIAAGVCDSGQMVKGRERHPSLVKAHKTLQHVISWNECILL